MKCVQAFCLVRFIFKALSNLVYNSAHAFLYKSMEGTTEHKWYEISREALLLEALIAKSEYFNVLFLFSVI